MATQKTLVMPREQLRALVNGCSSWVACLDEIIARLDATEIPFQFDARFSDFTEARDHQMFFPRRRYHASNH